MTLAELHILSKRIGIKLKQEGAQLTTAESCTGGLIASVITDIAGSSAWFERGFVTYSNLSKVEMLAVDPQVIETYGAVSEEVVTQMAQGAIAHSHAQYSIAVSGIAGPAGGSEEKLVGTVCIGWVDSQQQTRVETRYFNGDREQVRLQACFYALEKLEDLLNA